MEANHELTSDDGAGVFDDLGMRRAIADARAQAAKHVYLVEIAGAQKNLQTRTTGAEDKIRSAKKKQMLQKQRQHSSN